MLNEFSTDLLTHIYSLIDFKNVLIHIAVSKRFNKELLSSIEKIDLIGSDYFFKPDENFFLPFSLLIPKLINLKDLRLNGCGINTNQMIILIFCLSKLSNLKLLWIHQNDWDPKFLMPFLFNFLDENKMLQSSLKDLCIYHYDYCDGYKNDNFAKVLNKYVNLEVISLDGF